MRVTEIFVDRGVPSSLLGAPPVKDFSFKLNIGARLDDRGIQ